MGGADTSAICGCGAALAPAAKACGACGQTVVSAAVTGAVKLQDSTGRPFNLEIATPSSATQSVVAAAKTGEVPRGVHVPEKLGPYQVLGRLGEGGMGVVYRGHDETLERPVALKVLAKQRGVDPRLTEVEREARAIAAVTHPNVVQVYSAGEQDGLAYFAMELVPGPDLREVLEKKGPLAPEKARRYLEHAALGLRAAARKGIYHRDVKPANLLLDEREDQVKVADFGLAKRACVDASLAGTSLVAGTPLYVAPEVIKTGEGDHRADMYSLGATFYHLLAGEPPFGERSAADALVGHATLPAPDVRAARPDLPEGLAALIGRCLEKDPAARPATWDALIEELEASAVRVVVRPVEKPAEPVIRIALPPEPPAPPAIPAPPRRLPLRAKHGRWVLPAIAAVGVLAFARAHVRVERRSHEPVRQAVASTPGLGACTFSEMHDLLRRGPRFTPDLLAPKTIEEVARLADRQRVPFEPEDDECSTSGLPFAIVGSPSAVAAWHVHDHEGKTVVYAASDGSIKTIELTPFLHYLRATAKKRGVPWHRVCKEIGPFLPEQARRGLANLDATH